MNSKKNILLTEINGKKSLYKDKNFINTLDYFGFVELDLRNLFVIVVLQLHKILYIFLSTLNGSKMTQSSLHLIANNELSSLSSLQICAFSIQYI